MIDHEKPAGASRNEGPSTAPRRFSSRELFRDERRIEIEHQGATYLLQITRQGKLILTK